MAVGLAGDDSVSQQIQNTIDDEFSRVRGNIQSGESLHYCDECGDEISEKRRLAIKGGRSLLSIIMNRPLLNFNIADSK